MKKILLIACLFLSAGANAATWEKILDCDDGSAVIDRNTNLRWDAQLVIRDPGVLDYFNSSGLARLNFGQRELVIQGQNGYFHERANKQNYIQRDITSATDFSTFVTRTPYDEGYVFHVHREGSGLRVKKFYFVGPRSRCSDDGCYQMITIPASRKFLGDYKFNYCN